MSIISNLESRGLVDHEELLHKQTTNSKLKTYKRTHEDKVRAMLRNENIDNEEEMDPYSKTSTKRNSSKIHSLTQSGYQTTLLEKILQSQNNPELIKSNVHFQQRTLDLLTEVKEILGDMRSGRKTEEQRDKRDPIKNREVSGLAKDIAERNIGGIMNHMRHSMSSGADKYGLMSLAGSVKDMLASTLESGMFGDMVKESIQTSIVKAIFGDKGGTLVGNFKNDPMQAIQDVINTTAFGKNAFLSKLMMPHATKLKLDPNITRSSKDVNAAAVFDYRTHTTINTVIPDLLSRLVSQIEGKERTKFDHEKQQWVTVSQLLEEHSSKDTVSKYTKDVSNRIRSLIADGASKNQGGSAYSFIQRDKEGKVVKNADNKVMFNNDQAFVVVMNEVAKSGVTLYELVRSDPAKLVSEYKLYNTGAGVDEDTAVILVSMIQNGLSYADQTEVNDIDMTLRERVAKLNNIKEYSLLTADINKNEIKAHSKVKSGVASYSEAMTEMYGGRSGTGFVRRDSGKPKPKIRNVNANRQDTEHTAGKNAKYISPDKHLFGTTQSRIDEYNLSSRGYEATESELLQIKYAELKSKGMISEKEYKKLLDETASPQLKLKVDNEVKRLTAAWSLYATFEKADATAWGMSKITNETPGALKAKGYFDNPDQCIDYIKADGTVDIEKLQTRNPMFNGEYIEDLKRKGEEKRDGKFNFDMFNPVESTNEILNGIFTDPALAKKLGMGAGSVTGYALGKLINNHTFLKSPKMGYLLGAVGAGLMSMERTQHYLNQTLGPAGSVEGESGYSNREILIAKMFNKWLPAAGIGGKAAQLTYRFMSKMGPAGMLLGPVGALAVGGTVAAMTPGLIKVGKKMLFDDDGKGNKGILKSIGRGLRSIPGVNDIFGSEKDNRSDDEVLSSTISQMLKETDVRIQELENNPKRSEAEHEELKKLTSYRSELSNAKERLDSVIKMDDSETQDIESKRFRTDFLDKHGKVQQQYNADIIKRNKRNILGSAVDAKITIKSKDELGKLHAKKALEKYEGVDVSKLTDKEKEEYELLTSIAGGKSMTSLFDKRMSAYLEKEGVGIDKIASSLYEGDSLVTKLGHSVVHSGWTDENGKTYKGLMQLESKEEFDDWLANINPKSRKYVNSYIDNRNTLQDIKESLRGIAGVTVDSTTPGLSPRDRELAIEGLIRNGMMSHKNIMGFITNKYKVKKKDVINKISSVFELGGVDSDSLQKEALYANKIESLMGGGKGTDVNNIVKMKDLGGYKFRNGSKLSLAGCSIVAFNNALNILRLGGVSIEYLIEIANSYLTTDGGVTSDFMKDVSERMNLTCKIYNSLDNSFNNEVLLKFKPTSTKAVILLLKNAHGNGSHFVNLRAINSTKAIIDDPERSGTTDVSTSTLIASLLEVITIEKKTLDIKIKDTPGEVHPTRNASHVTDGIVGSMLSTDSSVNTKPDVGSIIAGKGSSGSHKDSVVNVRIVEDLTLPLKMTDSEAASAMSRHLRASNSGSKVSSAYNKNVESMRKQRAMHKEYMEAQTVQDNIARTADLLEGTSTGKGGAGTGSEVDNDKPLSNPSTGGKFAGLFKTAAGIVAGLSALTLKEIGVGLKDSVFGMFNNENTIDEDGNKRAADNSGNASKIRTYSRMAINTTKMGVTGVKNILKTGKNLTFGLGKGAVNIVDKAKDAAGVVNKLKDKDELMNAILKGADMVSDFPDKVISWFKMISDKIPFLGPKVHSAMNSPASKGIMGKVKSGLKTLMDKFMKFFPKNIAKAVWSKVSRFNILLTLGLAVAAFRDGYKNADYWLNKPQEDVSFTTKVFIGMLKALYNELPNVLIWALSMVPVIGPALGFVGAVGSLFLESAIGGFEGFLKMMGLRQETEKLDTDIPDFLAENDKLTKIEEDGKMKVKLSEKNKINATLDPSKAKTKNEDGTYNFTKDATKNANANEMYKLMKSRAPEAGVNTSLAMSQWATESGWGTSEVLNQKIATDNNVLFGVKKGSTWEGKTVKIMTQEVVPKDQLEKWRNKEGFEILGEENGKIRIKCYEEFRAYDSKEDAVDDYLKLMSENYQDGLDGYATDPAYAKNIARLMEGNFNIDDLHNTYSRNENIDPSYRVLASGYGVPVEDPNYMITSAFGERTLNGKTRPHNGIDFRGSKNDPVKSIGDGEVVYTGSVKGGGNTIKIKHPDGTESTYMHLNNFNVKNGDKVKTGQTIGGVGNTGGNYPDHLHLELKKDNKFIDPILAMGLDPGKLKLNGREIDAENYSWMEKNQGYVKSYSDRIKSIAEQKQLELAKEKQEPVYSPPKNNTKNSAEMGKGGPTTDVKIELDNADRIRQLERQNSQLLDAFNTMNKLLSRIVKNTEVNQNNIMKDAMMLAE